MKRTRWIAATILAMVAICVAVGPAGGTSAKTTMSVALSPLIGTGSNGVQQVTYGGKIGLHLDVTNTGKSTVNHIVIAVTSDTATFSDASRSECGQDPKEPKRMVCTLKQMKSGSPTFSVDLRFTAPASGSQVVSTPTVTVDAKSQGNPGNNGNGTTTGAPVNTVLVSSAGNSLVDSFLRGAETAATSTTLPQHSEFVMPGSLLGGVYGVETSVQETTEPPLCTTCLSLVTVLSIPASGHAGSPFSPTNPFTFTVTCSRPACRITSTRPACTTTAC